METTVSVQIPTYGSLQNKENGEYRCNHAKQLESSYKSPECLLNFQPQGDNTYAIKNVDNNQYYGSSIGSMSNKVEGDSQKWRLLWINDEQFYVQNVKNNEFMTKHASQLSSSAGKDEIWIITERSN